MTGIIKHRPYGNNIIQIINSECPYTQVAEPPVSLALPQGRPHRIIMERDDLVALLKDSLAKMQTALDALSGSPDSADDASAKADDKKAEKTLKRVIEGCESSQQKLADLRSLAQDRFKKLRKSRKRRTKAAAAVSEDDSERSDPESSANVNGTNGDVEQNAVEAVEPNAVEAVELNAVEAVEPNAVEDLLAEAAEEVLLTNGTENPPAKDPPAKDPPVIALKLRPIEQLLETPAAVMNGIAKKDDSSLRVPPTKIKLNAPAKKTTATREAISDKKVRIVLKRLPNDLDAMLKECGLNGSIPTTSNGTSSSKKTNEVIHILTHNFSVILQTGHFGFNIR